jgi:hypothetical protein
MCTHTRTYTHTVSLSLSWHIPQVDMMYVDLYYIEQIQVHARSSDEEGEKF